MDFYTTFINSDPHFIQDASETRKIKRGAYIYTPGEIADEIYIIKKGIIKICYPKLKNDNPHYYITKSLLTKGNIFGELVLVGEHARRDYALAVKPTEVQIYSKQKFQLLMQAKPFIQSLVLQQLGQKLTTIEERFADIILKNARSRIIEFLLELANHRGVKVGFDTMIENFLSQQEIANYTATARQTVSTVLNGLKAKNLIYYTRKKILIRDISLLEKELMEATSVANS